MDDHATSAQPASQPPIDLLRRWFVPIEHPTSSGDTVFRTQDGKAYRRDSKGVIRRIKRGK